MREGTLIERIEAATDRGPAPSGPFDVEALAASILSNLSRVLNDRRGCCEIRADYGLPDLNDMVGRPDALVALARIVRGQILAFEPRLQNVRVDMRPIADDPASIGFHISATALAGDRATRVSFDSVLNADRRFDLKG